MWFLALLSPLSPFDGSWRIFSHGVGDFSNPWTQNPASLVVQLEAMRDDIHGVYLNDIVDADHMLYASCDLTFLNVTLSYTANNGSWAVVNTTLSPSTLASILWEPLIFQMGTDELVHEFKLANSLSNHAIIMMSYLEQNITTLTLGYNSGLTYAAPALSVKSMVPVAIGVYPVTPIIILVILLYTYSFAALYIFFAAFTANHTALVLPAGFSKKRDRKSPFISALDLAQTWLTDPIPLVGMAFTTDDKEAVVRSASTEVLDMAPDENDRGRRLRLGIDDNGHFGVWRGLDAQKS